MYDFFCTNLGRVLFFASCCSLIIPFRETSSNFFDICRTKNFKEIIIRKKTAKIYFKSVLTVPQVAGNFVVNNEM
jgi:hypothetical protein